MNSSLKPLFFANSLRKFSEPSISAEIWYLFRSMSQVISRMVTYILRFNDFRNSEFVLGGYKATMLFDASYYNDL